MVGRRSLLIVLNNVLGAFLGFFALVAITRYLPPESLGFYAWAGAALGIPALLTSLGFHQAHIKRVSQGMDEAAANGTYFLVKLVLSFSFLGIVLAALWMWTHPLGKQITDATTQPVFLLVLLGYVLLSLRDFFMATYQAHRQAARGESVLFVDTIVSVACTIGASLLWARVNGRNVPASDLVDAVARPLNLQGPLTAADGGLLLATAYLLGRAISLVFAAVQFLLHRYPMGRPTLAVFASYRAFGLNLAIVSGLTVLYANMDRFLLGYFYSAVEVARYQVAFQALTPMNIVAIGVGTLLFPTISRLQSAGDHEEIRLATRRAERYLTMLLLPQLALALVFAKEGLNIFNARYVDAAPILRILAIFVFLNVLIVPARSLLLGAGHPELLVRLGLLNVFVVIPLHLLVIPESLFGVPTLGWREPGAALVAVVGSLVSYVYIKHHAIPWTGRDYVPPGFLRQALAGLLLGGILWMARSSLDPAYFTRLWQLAIVALLGSGLYLLLLVLVKEFTNEDWHFLRDLMHPGKLASYVGDELTGRSKQP